MNFEVIVPPRYNKKTKGKCIRSKVRKFVTVSKLMGMSNSELSEICQVHGLAKSGSRQDLLERIRTDFCFQHGWDWFDIISRKRFRETQGSQSDSKTSQRKKRKKKR